MRGALADLAAAARADLTLLGPAGEPLAEVAAIVERLGAGLDLAALDSPELALDTLAALGPAEGAAALVGKVLGYLRTRAGSDTAAAPTRRVRLAEAIAAYEAGPLAILSVNTRRTYRTWTRRLASAHPDADPAAVTAGDLKDLIAKHVLNPDGSRRAGPGAEATAITAWRHLWGYLEDKGWADAKVAARLRKPPIPEPRRRGYTPEEAALIRHLAGLGRDPWADRLVIWLAERAGLRNAEIVRLRCCDIDLDRGVIRVHGKGGKRREVPITPGLLAFLRDYLASRCPAGVAWPAWPGRRGWPATSRCCGMRRARSTRTGRRSAGVGSRTCWRGCTARPRRCSPRTASWRCTRSGTRSARSSTPGTGGR